MRRRTLLKAGLTAALARPALVRAQAATTLKFVPYADLALLDPAVSAFVTRNHVHDGVRHAVRDGCGRRRPAADAGGLHHRRRRHDLDADLRDGLRFHDGTPVLGRDVVASIQRWQANDAFGQALAAATDELSAPTDKVIKFRLKHRFRLLPEALAHPTNLMAAIMPERLAKTSADVRLTEIVGSGPFRYLAAERVPGARNVYARFDGLRPPPARHRQLLRRPSGGAFRPGRVADDARSRHPGRRADLRRGGLGRAAADGPGGSLRAQPA